MGVTINPNISFIISGVLLGEYVFDQNPERMDVIPAIQNKNNFSTLEGEDIYQSFMNDETVRTMTWSKTSRAHYGFLKSYAVRDANGNTIPAYFWDGTLAEMQGAEIEVLDVHATPIAGDFDLWTMSLDFKPTSDPEKLYRMNIPSEGQLSASGTPTLISVPDETYNIQIYDTNFSPMITGMAFNTISNTWTLEVDGHFGGNQTEMYSARWMVSTRFGWVVSKVAITGVFGNGSYELV